MEHVAELHSTFHPLMRVSCATPAHNRSMNKGSPPFQPYVNAWEFGKLQFSFLQKILKHHNNQSRVPDLTLLLQRHTHTKIRLIYIYSAFFCCQKKKEIYLCS